MSVTSRVRRNSSASAASGPAASESCTCFTPMIFSTVEVSSRTSRPAMPVEVKRGSISSFPPSGAAAGRSSVASRVIPCGPER